MLLLLKFKVFGNNILDRFFRYFKFDKRMSFARLNIKDERFLTLQNKLIFPANERILTCF